MQKYNKLIIITEEYGAIGQIDQMIEENQRLQETLNVLQQTPDR